ncbi:MAG: hypothetical protein II059_09370, partial [Clostridia bacterium]|nr:hypothetical protein [Clostridia bacterium]
MKPSTVPPPTFDSDGWKEFTVYVDLNGYTRQATHTSVIPKFERIYTKVEAKEATFTEAGNIEYYSCNDGNFYVRNGETYTKVAQDAVIIPPQGSEKINTNTYDNEYTGNLAIVNGWGGGSDGIYIENEEGTETENMTVTAKPGYDLDTVIFHVGWNNDRSEYARVNRGQLSVSEDGWTITVTNIGGKSVTLSTAFCDEDYYEPPDDPELEYVPCFTFFQVKSVDVYVLPNGETIYTKVAAKAATFTETGNTEYYTGSDG